MDNEWMNAQQIVRNPPTGQYFPRFSLYFLSILHAWCCCKYKQKKRRKKGKLKWMEKNEWSQTKSKKKEKKKKEVKWEGDFFGFEGLNAFSFKKSIEMNKKGLSALAREGGKRRLLFVTPSLHSTVNTSPHLYVPLNHG